MYSEHDQGPVNKMIPFDVAYKDRKSQDELKIVILLDWVQIRQMVSVEVTELHSNLIIPKIE